MNRFIPHIGQLTIRGLAFEIITVQVNYFTLPLSFSTKRTFTFHNYAITIEYHSFVYIIEVLSIHVVDSSNCIAVYRTQ